MEDKVSPLIPQSRDARIRESLKNPLPRGLTVAQYNARRSEQSGCLGDALGYEGALSAARKPIDRYRQRALGSAVCKGAEIFLKLRVRPD